jgi:SOS response regulatory protein OraA/RecX
VVPRVTSLRAQRGGRVLVEVDGREWRVLPADAVVRARLSPGTELDRERLRRLARERRRSAALAAAGSILRTRDLPVQRLDERLRRRGIAPAERAEAVATLVRLGVVEDARFSRNRALALAGRGAGDAAIRFDLERYGVETETIDDAIAGLEPEPVRAMRIVSARGRSAATGRFLVRKGFTSESVETALGELLA